MVDLSASGEPDCGRGVTHWCELPQPPTPNSPSGEGKVL